MTKEEYKEKFKDYSREWNNAYDEYMNLQSQAQSKENEMKEIHAKKCELDTEYAESVTGFKKGEIVRVTRTNRGDCWNVFTSVDKKTEVFDIIIDRMYIDERWHVFGLHGRKITKSGEPSRNGTTKIQMSFYESICMDDLNKIEHISE